MTTALALCDVKENVFFVFVLSLLFLAGCATPAHQLPDIQDNRVYAAAAEIAATPEPTPPQPQFEYTHGCDIELLTLSQFLFFRLGHTTYR